jgi:group I intron endonuclease
VHYLYRILCLINHKIYIGQTTNYRKRWSYHKGEARREKPCMIINQAIKKYGEGNFVFEVIATCKTYEDANELERQLIIQYDCHISGGKGYNVHPGGNNASPSEETKQYIRYLWASGVLKPNSGCFVATTDWPEDQTLLAMVNELGGTKVSNALDTDVSGLFKRLKKKGLKHNRKPGDPETTFQPGSKHKRAKLNEEQVLKIVQLSQQGLLQREIAAQFNVSRLTVSAILNGQRWSHLTGIKRS